MNERFPAAQVTRVLDQALLYQCACPAQVCRTIFELRDLHDYQLNCASDTDQDRAVHESIAAAANRAHEVMEDCLAQVLALEGWDMATLTMPADLRKKAIKPI